MDSRRASIQDELLNNLLNDITEPNIQIPSVTESNTYFAPISPANTTNNTNATNGVKLLEMLHRGNKANQNGQGDSANTAIPMMKNCSIKDLGRLNISFGETYTIEFPDKSRERIKLIIIIILISLALFLSLSLI